MTRKIMLMMFLCLPPLTTLTAVWFLMRYVYLLITWSDADSLTEYLPVFAVASVLSTGFWIFLPSDSFLNFSTQFVMNLFMGVNSALNAMALKYT